MRTIYIDSNSICHADYADGRTAVETDALDNVHDASLAYYIYVPKGSTYTKPNGNKIHGEFIQCLDANAADKAELQAKVAEYEKALAEIEAALGV